MGSNDILVVCPHCELLFLVESVACGIFRHAVDKISYVQINAHADKSTCDKLIADDSIIGCGKPMRVVVEEGVHRAVVCDYV